LKISDLNFLKIKVEKHPTTGIDLEYLKKHSAIAIFLLNYEKDKILLVNQYRPGKQKKMYEIPAGLIDDGEDEDTAMWRELLEETGYKKKDIELLYKNEKPLMISPGYTTESLYFYIAKLKNSDVIPEKQSLDKGEDLSCEWIEINMIESITDDIKTIFSLYLYEKKVNIHD